MSATRAFHGLFLLVLLTVTLVNCRDSEPMSEGSEASDLDDTQTLADESARQSAEAGEVRSATLNTLRDRKLPSETPASSYQEGFRKTFPFHIQTLAASEPSEDGSRTLIVSEPPPNISLDDILLTVGESLQSHSVKRHSIGYGGWVSDVVLSIKGSDETVAITLSRLSRVLFGTSYKAYALALPAAAARQKYDLDLDVTAEEVEAWIDNENPELVAVERGKPMAASSVYRLPTCSVLHAEAKGVVAWWLPGGLSVADCRAEVREFAIDSDLIVGAIARNEGLLVVGRERVVPVDLMPPLRLESVELLDRASGMGPKGELGQSYERLYRFAGRVDQRNDWAPIYLSRELIDTEYGSLLNITDQILKSWSQGGSVSYYNFHYPSPKKWPNIVRDLMVSNQSLTFNWNTRGATYGVDRGGKAVAALNRTGSLPVTYIPEGIDPKDIPAKVLQAEDIAYNKFGRQSDPNLVRVVQYASLYQIFSSYRDARPESSKFSLFTLADQRQRYPALDALLDELELELQRASQDKLREMASEIADQLDLNEFFDLSGPEEAADFYYRTLLEAQTGKKIEAQGKEIRYSFEEELVLSALAGIRKIPEKYSTALAKRANAWIHTPVVVLSSVEAEPGVLAVGGHNLYARMEKLYLSDEVPAGKVEVREGKLFLNPADATKGSRLVRTAGRFEGKAPEELAAQLSGELRRVPIRAARPPVNALKMTSNGINDVMRDTVPVTRHADLGPQEGLGWMRRLGSGSGKPPDIDAVGDVRVVLERRDGRYYIQHDRGPSYLEARTIEDATDAMVYLMRRGIGGDRSLRIEMRGFQPHEGTSFARSVQVRVSQEKLPREISALVREEGLPVSRILEVSGKKYDFGRAKVEVTDIVETESGFQRSIQIEAPREGAEGAGRSTIDVEFSRSTPRRVIETITSRIREAVHRIIAEVGGRIDSIRFNMRLNAEAKKISAETGVDLKIVRQRFADETGDIYFASRGVDAPDFGSYDDETRVT